MVRLALRLSGVALFTAVAACGAVLPEVASPVKPPPAGKELEPGPPQGVYFVAVAGAEIPEKTRDGRAWDALGGAAPDPVAKVLIDDVEILKTPAEADTLRPTWPNQTRANYRIRPGAHLRVEVWDSNALTNQPICLHDFHVTPERVDTEPMDIRCPSGARVQLVLAPAKARWGLGLSYELRTGGAAVSRVLRESPAGREKLTVGEEIVSVSGSPVAPMKQGELQSAINSHAAEGVELVLRDASGKERKVTLKEGPIYPSIDEGITFE